MRLLFTTLIVAVTCIGCASLNRKVTPKNEMMVYASDSATFYRNVDNNRVMPGERRKVRQNDSVQVISYSWDYVPWTSTYETHHEYLIMQGKETLWVDMEDLNYPLTPQEIQLRSEEVEYITNGKAVILPKAQSEEAWGRAVAFVAKNSDMKVQIATDYMIDTYNPTKESQSGYTITRRVQGEEVIIDIVAKGNAWGGQAYKYIRYGR